MRKLWKGSALLGALKVLRRLTTGSRLHLPAGGTGCAAGPQPPRTSIPSHPASSHLISPCTGLWRRWQPSRRCLSLRTRRAGWWASGRRPSLAALSRCVLPASALLCCAALHCALLLRMPSHAALRCCAAGLLACLSVLSQRIPHHHNHPIHTYRLPPILWCRSPGSTCTSYHSTSSGGGTCWGCSSPAARPTSSRWVMSACSVVHRCSGPATTAAPRSMAVLRRRAGSCCDPLVNGRVRALCRKHSARQAQTQPQVDFQGGG